MNFINSIAKKFEFCIFFCEFLWIFDDFFSGFRAKFQKRVTPFAFSINFAKTNQKIQNCRTFSNLWKLFNIIHLQSYFLFSIVPFFSIFFSNRSFIQYYSILSNRVLSHDNTRSFLVDTATNGTLKLLRLVISLLLSFGPAAWTATGQKLSTREKPSFSWKFEESKYLFILLL